MTLTELEKIKRNLTNYFKQQTKDELLVDIIFDDISNELIITIFWDRLNGLYWKENKTFRFHKDEYQKVLETEIKSFKLIDNLRQN